MATANGRLESELALKDLGTLLSKLQHNLSNDITPSGKFTSPYELQKFKAVSTYTLIAIA